MTTFNNNFILRASLEQSDGKTSGWWFGVVVLATKNAKGAKNGERGMGWILILTQRHRGTKSQRRGNFSVPLCLFSGSWRVARSGMRFIDATLFP